MIDRHPLAGGVTLWAGLCLTYLAIFGCYWLYNLAHLAVDLREAANIAHFTRNRLGLSEHQLRCVTWPEVARRIVEARLRLVLVAPPWLRSAPLALARPHAAARLCACRASRRAGLQRVFALDQALPGWYLHLRHGHGCAGTLRALVGTSRRSAAPPPPAAAAPAAPTRPRRRARRKRRRGCASRAT